MCLGLYATGLATARAVSGSNVADSGKALVYSTVRLRRSSCKFDASPKVGRLQLMWDGLPDSLRSTAKAVRSRMPVRTQTLCANLSQLAMDKSAPT